VRWQILSIWSDDPAQLVEHVGKGDVGSDKSDPYILSFERRHLRPGLENASQPFLGGSSPNAHFTPYADKISVGLVHTRRRFCIVSVESLRHFNDYIFNGIFIVTTSKVLGGTDCGHADDWKGECNLKQYSGHAFFLPCGPLPQSLASNTVAAGHS